MATWGDTTSSGTAFQMNYARYMGGTFDNVANAVLNEIWFYCGDTGTIRLAVYQGGALDNPVGASLIIDAGEVTVNAGAGWYGATGLSENLTASAITWIAFKSDTVQYYYNTAADGTADFQTGRGRYDSVTEGDSATEPWNSTIPNAGSFDNYWYSTYIVYSISSPVPIFMHHYTKNIGSR